MGSARSLGVSTMVGAVLIGSVSFLVGCGASERDREAELERQRQEAFCAAVVGYMDADFSFDTAEMGIPSRSDVEGLSRYAAEIYNNAPAEDKPALEPVVIEIRHSHSQLLATGKSDSFWKDAGSLLAWGGGQFANDQPYVKARQELKDYTYSQSC